MHAAYTPPWAGIRLFTGREIAQPMTVRPPRVTTKISKRRIMSSKKTTKRRSLVQRAPKHKRCPRCNQRLFVIKGEIEAHMEIPSAYGTAPQQCLPKSKAP